MAHYTKKTSNPIAKSLSNRLFTPKVVHSKEVVQPQKGEKYHSQGGR
jgi:hypothetical protein